MRSIILKGTLAALAVCIALPHAEHRPNVLLITLDTVRADRMGFLGSARGLTPRLDALARASVTFTRAYSQAPITTVSHATLLTGTYPLFHHVTEFGAALPAAVPYLPDLFRSAGYRTGAFVGSLILDPRNGTAHGFDRGFDTYDAGFRLRRPGDDRYQSVERRGSEVVARARRWLASGGSRPWFLWVHLFDAHDPYDPPGDLKSRWRSAPYDGEIAAVDRAAGALIDAVDPQTLIAVASDHGEALGDHGEETHGLFLYDETLHVPLVIRLPNRQAGRVTRRVRLVDVAPTMLQAAAIAVPSTMQGESLIPLVRPKPDATRNQQSSTSVASATSVASEFRRTDDDRPAYAETDYPRQAFGWSPLVAWRADRFLFIRAPRRELYDEVADATARRNIAAARSRVADGMDGELRQFMERTAAGDGRSSAPRDPALAERLAALGYVGGSPGSPPATGVDPKDRVAIANALHTAVVAVEDAAFQKAVPLLEKVVASEPTIHIAQLNLGIARARQRRYADAIDPLKRAIALNPDAPMPHYELAAALYETGDLKASAAEFAIVAARMPQWADARYSLGSVYARIDRIADAMSELHAALALEPRHFRANLLLGRILTLRREPAAAIPFLENATAVQPASSEAHAFLAEAYEQAGRAADAAEERRRAASLSKKQ